MSVWGYPWMFELFEGGENGGVLLLMKGAEGGTGQGGYQFEGVLGVVQVVNATVNATVVPDAYQLFTHEEVAAGDGHVFYALV